MARDNHPHVLESNDYRETVAKLKQDPIIKAMAREVRTADVELEGVDMLAALREYKRRGGKIPTHIGGPVQAIRELNS